MGVSKSSENRFLVFAPTGADALNIGAVLTRAGVEHALCADLDGLVAGIQQGPAGLLVTEEAVLPNGAAKLTQALQHQPAWSDIPLVVIAGGQTIDWWARSGVDHLGLRANLHLLERPLRGSTLLAAIRSVIRARQRQYEVRDLLLEREKLLESLESRVAERTAKLQELVAELEGFSYSVSHDLRAPLRVMAGYARAIMDDHEAALAPDVKNYVRRIAETADRMDRLTQDVLAYTRVSRAEIVLEPVDLDAMIQSLLEQYPTLSAARQSIRVARPLAKVQGHSPSLIQAVSNLVENALKFVPPDRTPLVEIRTLTNHDQVKLVVSDNGIGIAPVHHKRIFGIFERLAPKSVPGTGIGLAIVKKAVDRMGGTIGLQSHEGQGSEFWIELPKASES